MKKRNGFYSLLAASVVLLGACSGGTEAEEGNVTEDGKIIMTVGQQTQPNSKLPEGDSYGDNAYRRAIEEEYDVKIESAFEAAVGDDYDRQVSLAIASGDLPDVMTVSLDEFEELAANDLIADLTDVYEEYASDYLKDIYSSYDDAQLEAATIDDRLMGLPGTATDFGPNLVWIRQDWLDQLNIQLDQDGNHAISLDELKTTAQAFIDADISGTGKTVGLALNSNLTADSHGSSGYTANAILNAFQAYPKTYLETADGQLEYGSNTPEMEEGLAYMKELFDDGILDPQFGTRSGDDITAMLVNGELGILPGPWHLSDWGLVQVKTADSTAEFTPFAVEDSEGQVNAVDKVGVGNFVVVRKDFSNPEAVVQMMNLLFDEIANSSDLETEYPEIYDYYQKAVDGSVRPLNIEMYSNLSEIADAVEATEAAEGKLNIDDISNFNVKNNALKIKNYLDDPENADPTDWAVYESRSMAIGQVMNGVRQENILNEVYPAVIFQTIRANERNGAQIAKLEEETFIKYVTGEEPLSNFSSYVSTWESQGGTEILNEMSDILAEEK
ncbi:extracellular solute-binding protein [Enterococcus sp. LJL90]